MATKTILSIGLELASDDVTSYEFESDISLLDWDIILFRPDIGYSLSASSEEYQGKPCLSETSSFRRKEQCKHWRREIKEAVGSGKTVVVFLSELQEVYVDTGKREYSGVGKSRRTTKIVDLHSNYSTIPLKCTPISTKGSAIKLTSLETETISPYWSEFKDVSQYKVILTGDMIPVCLVTKSGNKPVGAIYRGKDSNGSLVLLPDIDFNPSSFFNDDDESWTPAAIQFAARMVSTIISLDKALHSTSEVTPEPHWAASSDYALQKEVSLNQELLLVEKQIGQARQAKEAILQKIKESRRSRSLLYEKGKPLENAIIDGLRILGFQAAPFKESNSEFDVVFESAEGRLIGEAEGKDNKAINIDKLRQLAMNIHEDLQRDEVTEPAKGVLFGNAYRLSPLPERETPFTEKCISAAKSSSTALVPTPELFMVVRSLLNNPDDDYATSCRQAILDGVGIVSFPTAGSDVKSLIEQVTSTDALALISSNP